MTKYRPCHRLHTKETVRMSKQDRVRLGGEGGGKGGQHHQVCCGYFLRAKQTAIRRLLQLVSLVIPQLWGASALLHVHTWRERSDSEICPGEDEQHVTISVLQ